MLLDIEVKIEKFKWTFSVKQDSEIFHLIMRKLWMENYSQVSNTNQFLTLTEIFSDIYGQGKEADKEERENQYISRKP